MMSCPQVTPQAFLTSSIRLRLFCGGRAPLTRKEAVSKLSELTSKSNAYALLAKDGRYASHLDEREGKLHFVEKPPSGTGIPDSSSSENPGGE
jgi:hypothetical protein